MLALGVHDMPRTMSIVPLSASACLSKSICGPVAERNTPGGHQSRPLISSLLRGKTCLLSSSSSSYNSSTWRKDQLKLRRNGVRLGFGCLKRKRRLWQFLFLPSLGKRRAKKGKWWASLALTLHSQGDILPSAKQSAAAGINVKPRKRKLN